MNDWNALPEAVVTSGSINQFKGRLGRWWKNDPIMYPNIGFTQIHGDVIRRVTWAWANTGWQKIFGWWASRVFLPGFMPCLHLWGLPRNDVIDYNLLWVVPGNDVVD